VACRPTFKLCTPHSRPAAEAARTLQARSRVDAVMGLQARQRRCCVRWTWTSACRRDWPPALAAPPLAPSMAPVTTFLSYCISSAEARKMQSTSFPSAGSSLVAGRGRCRRRRRGSCCAGAAPRCRPWSTWSAAPARSAPDAAAETQTVHQLRIYQSSAPVKSGPPPSQCPAASVHHTCLNSKRGMYLHP
jgi:hypothetical protein